MEPTQLDWIANFIWGIADDVLRDYYKRGKYRDVILPMTVIRRLDAVLEPTKKAVLDMKDRLDKSKISSQEAPLRQAAGQSFYNASAFMLRDLRSRGRAQTLKADFEAYLDGFSPNVQEIIEKFKFRNQVPTLVEADILGGLIEKFLDPSINLSPKPALNSDGSERLPGLDNHGMGTIFEELIRRFNEENNEEAGEHFTPRDIVTLMADLVLKPVADKVVSGAYLVYDGACGTGGMLTVSEQRLLDMAKDHGKDPSIHLYGQEVEPETYAISKADLVLKGEGEEADNFVFGSTLSHDGFASLKFDFMLSNPPYGKSWKNDMEKMGGKDSIKDPRFIITHAGDPEYSLVTRSSDGQMMFLANMLSKMKVGTRLGSRIAEVHNGSSLFTGDAGQGESNIRRWIIENDWLEAIIALPLNIFYNTGIATYIWLLSNRKPEHRKGKVQLIDATQWFEPLRKNLGKKNCRLSDADIRRIADTFLEFKETEQSKVFPNEAFGYWKVTVERPLRLKVEFNHASRARLKFACAKAKDEDLPAFADKLAESLGSGPHMDFNAFLTEARKAALKEDFYFPVKRENLLKNNLAERDENGVPVVKKAYPLFKTKVDPLRGLFEAMVVGRQYAVEYEPDTELRDTEQVPLLEDGGIEAFIQRQVLPYAKDAWIDESKTKIGYEISFNRYFYKPQPLRTLEEIKADIAALEKETEGLLKEALE
ncbi:MAG TPA: class I SAM-dependent DNA methyltransferase [bacterium]|nr:class I SAM-dependent DNA methyltransferase [bacterium]